jgi:hypothetical protein
MLRLPRAGEPSTGRLFSGYTSNAYAQGTAQFRWELIVSALYQMLMSEIAI